MLRRTWLMAVAVALMGALGVKAQPRPAFFDTEATVRIVGAPPLRTSVPLLIVLPATGGSAEEIYAALATHIALGAYVVMLPAGAPTRAEYADFDAFVRWFDARVQTDIVRAEGQFPIDRDRIYLAGFSLGGDLTWALLARHPDRVRGGFVMSSGCSASMSAAGADTLRRRGARVVFAVGDQDPRSEGLHRAYRFVRERGVSARVLTFSGGHQLPSAEVLDDGFREMFGAP